MIRHLIIVLCCASLVAPRTLASEGEVPVTKTFDKEGFAVPDSGDNLRFPRDHGSHPEFKNEWWYLTGHFSSPDQKIQYGFQLTFFRAAQKDEQNSEEKSQFFMAHAALFDKNTKQFVHEERMNREGWNASAAIGKMNVFNENWYLKMTDEESEEMLCRFSIKNQLATKLTLTPAKKRNLFGDQGVSRKGEDPHSLSYYINYSRLHINGSILHDGKLVDVSGLAWMDHEISSNQLSKGQIGWNWTSLILNDGTELMAYAMRREDGSKDPHSALTIIHKDGTLENISSGDFDWIPTRTWKSLRTEAVYPVDHRINWIDSERKRHSINVRTLGDDQEIHGDLSGFVYWEGACIAYDENHLKLGAGYTELTGYESSLQGRF